MISAGEQEFVSCNKALVNLLFSEKDAVTVEDFLEIKFSLTKALLHYEFHQFETDDNDTISASDFAKSMLSTLQFNQAMTYLKRIGSIELEGRVSFDEYVAFAKFIEKCDIIKMKIATYRYLTFSMLRELCDDFESQDPFCKAHGIKISDN